MIELPTPVFGLGLVGVTLVNFSVALFGYVVALGHIKRMAEIDQPECTEMFRQHIEGRADQPLSADDIDRIETWDDEEGGESETPSRDHSESDQNESDTDQRREE